jgi:hypothetical protein
MVRPRRAFKFLMSRGLLLGVAMHLALLGWVDSLSRSLDEPAFAQRREYAYSEAADKLCNLSVWVDRCQAMVRVSVRKCPDTVLGDCAQNNDTALGLHAKTM